MKIAVTVSSDQVQLVVAADCEKSAKPSAVRPTQETPYGSIHSLRWADRHETSRIDRPELFGASTPSQSAYEYGVFSGPSELKSQSVDSKIVHGQEID